MNPDKQPKAEAELPIHACSAWERSLSMSRDVAAHETCHQTPQNSPVSRKLIFIRTDFPSSMLWLRS